MLALVLPHLVLSAHLGQILSYLTLFCLHHLGRFCLCHTFGCLHHLSRFCLCHTFGCLLILGRFCPCLTLCCLLIWADSFSSPPSAIISYLAHSSPTSHLTTSKI